MWSLRAKLVATFLVVSVAGTILSFILVRSETQRAFDDLVLAQNQQTFTQTLLSYYSARGSWDGVERFMANQAPPPQSDRPPAPPPFVLIDPQARVLVPGGQFRPGDIVASDRIAQGTPIKINGRVVGIVIVETPRRGGAEDQFLARAQQALLYGAVGATLLALILALVLSQTVTRPLRELVRATRAMATGDLRQSVPVRTRDELGELAAAFNQLSADLARATDLRRQMTADIAHELRTPITVLSGYLESMHDGSLQATPERIALLEQEVQTLNRLVSDLRTLSLADAGELSLLMKETSPRELLERTAASFARLAEEKEIVLKVDATDGRVRVDAERMTQVLSNLVSNALRYTPQGGTIALGSERRGEKTILTVRDNGAGIAPQDLPHIFDRFYRADASRSQAEGESGLGLAIARSLVLAQGGEISVKSELGSGTTIEIELPNAG